MGGSLYLFLFYSFIYSFILRWFLQWFYFGNTYSWFYRLPLWTCCKQPLQLRYDTGDNRLRMFVKAVRGVHNTIFELCKPLYTNYLCLLQPNVFWLNELLLSLMQVLMQILERLISKYVSSRSKENLYCLSKSTLSDRLIFCKHRVFWVSLSMLWPIFILVNLSHEKIDQQMFLA